MRNLQVDPLPAITDGLSYDFPLSSDTSLRKLIDYEEAGHNIELAEAADDQERAYVAAATARVDRGTLTAEEARDNTALLRAIGADLRTRHRRADAMRAWLKGDRLEQPPSIAEMFDGHEHRRSWADKVRMLRTIIDGRRRTFDADVAKGRFTHDQAAIALERIEAIHQLYWCDGFAWDGTDQQLKSHSDRLLDQVASE